MARERSQELRDEWKARLTQWKPEQLIFVDESAANERTADRKYGWATKGAKAFAKISMKRSEKWSILPAYTLDGFIAWDVVQGSYNKQLFNDFIRNFVLPLCNHDPNGLKSILIMDNAKIHHSEVYPYFSVKFLTLIRALP